MTSEVKVAGEVITYLAGEDADKLIAAEIRKQDEMWGVTNDRADATDNQLTEAAMAQIVGVLYSTYSGGVGWPTAEDAGYPDSWSGYRRYSPPGSGVADLVVAAAFIRQEIKRRILNGESKERVARRPNQPYNPETGLPKGEVAGAAPTDPYKSVADTLRKNYGLPEGVYVISLGDLDAAALHDTIAKAVGEPAAPLPKATMMPPGRDIG